MPTVAIAIMTGILIGAYDRLADGTWERIASLGIGSIFLFALTIEVIKKRYHMNVISSLLKDLHILAEWEFIYHQKLGDWSTTVVTGILVGAVEVVIPVFWYKYKKQEEKKEPEKMRRLINIEPISVNC